MDIKAIAKIKKGQFDRYWIDFENNLIWTFVSTSKVLKAEKLLDLT